MTPSEIPGWVELGSLAAVVGALIFIGRELLMKLVEHKAKNEERRGESDKAKDALINKLVDLLAGRDEGDQGR